MQGTVDFKGSPQRVSYAVVLLTFVLVGWLHLATPFLVTLFGYLALEKLSFWKRGGKWTATALFVAGSA